MKIDDKNSPGCVVSLIDTVTTFAYPMWLGYVISLIWNWHIAGWNALPVLGYTTAASVCLIFNLVRPKKGLVGGVMAFKLMDAKTKRTYRENTKLRLWVGLSDKAIPPALVLFIAWLMT